MKKILLIIFCFFITTGIVATEISVKIAIVKKKNLKEYNIVAESFVKHLKEKGYTINVKEFLFYNIDVAKGISNFKPDLIFTLGTSVTKLVSEEFQGTPVVFAMVVDPEGSGISGKKVTGVSLDMPENEQFRIIRKVLPDVKNGGVFYTPDENESNIKRAVSEADSYKLNIKTYPLVKGDELPYSEMSRMDFLWIVPDTQVCRGSIIKRLLMEGLKSMTPVVGISPLYAKAGALMALSCNYSDIGEQAGEMAVRVIKGEAPEGIVFQKPRLIEYFINATVAARLKIFIPGEVLDKAAGVFGR